MPTRVACRRSHRRHRLVDDGRCRVDFTYPKPHGAELSLAMLDISVAGLCFMMADEMGEVEPGMAIDEVVIRLGDLEIRGDLMVIHVNNERGLCGALLYPKEDIDLIKIRSVIAGIEVVEST
jgi:hypothetical protein